MLQFPDNEIPGLAAGTENKTRGRGGPSPILLSHCPPGAPFILDSHPLALGSNEAAKSTGARLPFLAQADERKASG